MEFRVSLLVEGIARQLDLFAIIPTMMIWLC